MSGRRLISFAVVAVACIPYPARAACDFSGGTQNGGVQTVVSGIFRNGGTLNFSATPSSNVASAIVRDQNGNFVQNIAFGAQTLTLQSGQYSLVFNYSGPIASAYSYSFCPLDSLSLQASVSKTEAITSVHSVGSSLQNGISSAFSENSSPIYFNSTGAFQSFTSPNVERDWNIWSDLQGNGWSITDGSSANDLRGGQFNFTTGLSRKLNRDMLIGWFAGYENFKYRIANVGNDTGYGYTLGTYFAGRLNREIQFYAAGGGSRIAYDSNAAGADGKVNGHRWFLSSGIFGTYAFGSFGIEPSAKAYILWERDNQWIDSLLTFQDARSFSAGNVALGGKIIRAIGVWKENVVSIYTGAFGEWGFSSHSTIPPGTPVGFIGDGWSARVTAGISVTSFNNAVLSIGSEYAGLGNSYKNLAYSVRGSWPF